MIGYWIIKVIPTDTWEIVYVFSEDKFLRFGSDLEYDCNNKEYQFVRQISIESEP